MSFRKPPTPRTRVGALCPIAVWMWPLWRAQPTFPLWDAKIPTQTSPRNSLIRKEKRKCDWHHLYITKNILGLSLELIRKCKSKSPFHLLKTWLCEVPSSRWFRENSRKMCPCPPGTYSPYPALPSQQVQWAFRQLISTPSPAGMSSQPLTHVTIPSASDSREIAA